jgi:hypothetical protein
MSTDLVGGEKAFIFSMGKMVSDKIFSAEEQYDFMPVTILSETKQSWKVHSCPSRFIAYIA